MAGGQPVGASRYFAADPRPETTWADVVRHLDRTNTFWLATTRADGLPHVMPLLAVCVEGRMYFCAGPRTQKARNLARDPHCVLTTTTPGLDIVVEGTAVLVTDQRTLEDAADVYRARYGWDAEPRDGAFQGEGAPTAGPPPLNLYRLQPARAFGFGTDGSLNAMRWTFSQA